MKLYLAATAPGSEAKKKGGFLFIPNRLLSFYLIRENMLEAGDVFTAVCKYKKGKTSEDIYGSSRIP